MQQFLTATQSAIQNLELRIQNFFCYGGLMSADPGFSVVLPCFNEVEAIEESVRGLVRVLEGRAPFEIIVVDDGSTDGSGAILDRLETSQGLGQLRVVHHDVNTGYGSAIKTGIRRARSDVIVITDADGTYPNERIPDLLAELESADMVVGARVGEGVQYSVIRRIPKVFLQSYTSWLVGRKIPDMNSGLRAFKAAVAMRYFRVLPDGFSLTTTITVAMMRAGYDVRFLPISYARRIGRSRIRPIRDTLGFVQLILRTGMYFAPLRVLLPLVWLLSMVFLGSLGYDVLVLRDLTDKTVLLLLFTLNTALFALLADMIDKRS